MHRIAALSAALVALAACSAEPSESGTITGVVKLGPIMPVCQEGVPCDGGYQGAKVVLRTPNGQPIQRATADNKGEFRMDVPAGRFEVAIDVEGPMPTCAPAQALVKARETVRVEIDCDSGIR
jgi:hypothetical protein